MSSELSPTTLARISQFYIEETALGRINGYSLEDIDTFVWFLTVMRQVFLPHCIRKFHRGAIPRVSAIIVGFLERRREEVVNGLGGGFYVYVSPPVKLLSAMTIEEVVEDGQPPAAKKS